MPYDFNPPPGWPKPPRGWLPPAGWEPDPAWPPRPEGWELWVTRRRPFLKWFVAAGACGPLAVLALFFGLGTTSLGLVYASIALSIGWLPLVVTGVVSLLRSQRGPG